MVTDTAAVLRAQIAFSTDKYRLEREARRAEVRGERSLVNHLVDAEHISKSALQSAFENAAQIVCTQIVRDQLVADETFKAGVLAIFGDVATKLFAEDIRERIVAKIVEAVVTGLGERYR